MMINSIRPRTFIRTPMPMASRSGMPVAIAASAQATPLLTTATARTTPHMSHM